MSIADFDRLARERYVSLATFRKSGVAVATPVWAAPHSGKLYVVSAGAAGKIKRLRAGNRARIAACDVRGNVHGEWIDARARRIDDASVIARAMEALRRKYGWQMAALNFFSRLSGRISKRTIIEIEL